MKLKIAVATLTFGVCCFTDVASSLAVTGSSRPKPRPADLCPPISNNIAALTSNNVDALRDVAGSVLDDRAFITQYCKEAGLTDVECKAEGITAETIERWRATTGSIVCKGTNGYPDSGGSGSLILDTQTVLTAQHVFFHKSTRDLKPGEKPASNETEVVNVNGTRIAVVYNPQGPCEFTPQTGDGEKSYKLDLEFSGSYYFGNHGEYIPGGDPRDWAVIRLKEPVIGPKPFDLSKKMPVVGDSLFGVSALQKDEAGKFYKIDGKIGDEPILQRAEVTKIEPRYDSLGKPMPTSVDVFSKYDNGASGGAQFIFNKELGQMELVAIDIGSHSGGESGERLNGVDGELRRIIDLFKLQFIK